MLRRNLDRRPNLMERLSEAIRKALRDDGPRARDQVHDVPVPGIWFPWNPRGGSGTGGLS